MIKNKQRKCRNCKEKFTQYNSLDPYCKLDCKIDDTLKKVRKERIRKDRKEKKDGLEKLKTPTNKANELQDEINKIARLIDYGNKCMCCGSYPKKPQGAHFKSVGGHAPIRFNLLNIWINCYSCNGEKGGAVHEYDDGLIELYGKEYWEYLKFGLMKQYPYLGLRKDDFPPLIKTAREIVRELEKDLKIRTPEQRIELRNEINKKLGIYA